MEEEVRCEHCRYNPQIVEQLKNDIPSDDIISRLSDVFKIFGDSTRIRILWALFDKELCVFDISEAPVGNQPPAAHVKAGTSCKVAPQRKKHILLA